MFYDNYRLIKLLRPKNILANTQLWLAYDLIGQKNIVIKQLLANSTPTQYHQFFQEYQVYQQLQQLNAAQRTYFFHLHNNHLIPSQHGLVFDYYRGCTLRQLQIADNLTFDQKISYLLAVCTAVEILHSQGIVHCDIKPSNILICHSSVKLFDFGLAKSADNTEISLTTAGTPRYMSPEQLTGGIITYQSDYYSLGVVIYETLLKKNPFFTQLPTSDSLQIWAVAHCQSPFLPIYEFDEMINAQLQNVFNHLLAKFSHNRPKTMATTIAVLKNLQKLLK